MKIAAGSKIGPYEILSPIGTGGMGEVYKARDAQLGREAAIKVLPENISTQKEALARLENEARLASSLNHPNIVTIYSMGWESRHRYIAMEYIDGPTIQDLIDKGPMPVDQALNISAQVADGLAKAHEAGIIHRDLKPKNVMLTKDGVAKILDFGLSKLAVSIADSEEPTPVFVDPVDGFTKPGTILGTVEYMSPEQASGRRVDFRSDQFSMGSLIYAILTGKKPFHRETPIQTLSQIIEGEPQSLSQINPRVPQRLDQVVRRCMMKDPQERYASTRDLAHDLRELDLSRRAPARHWTRREWIRASLVILLLLAVVSGLWIWLRRPYQPAPAALEWYRKGLEALHSMTFDTARKAFEQAVADDPKFALAHASLAIAYDSMDYSERATKSMLQAMAAAQEARLTSADQVRLRALGLIVSREYDHAVPLLQQLENDAGGQEKAAAALESGWLAERREDTQGAAAAYERALGINPRYAAATLRLGFIQQRLADNDRARKSFTEAENLYNAATDLEGVTETLYQRAYFLVRHNGTDEAMPLIDRALGIAHTMGNQYQEIRLQLVQASALRDKGDHARARELAERAIESAMTARMDTLAISGLINIGGVLRGSGDYESAGKYYSRALNIARDGKIKRYEALASLSLAALFELKNQPEESRRFAEAAKPFYSRAGYRKEFAQVMTILGSALHRLGEFDQGIKTLREALPRAVQIQDLRLELQIRDRLIETLRDKGAWPEALQESEQAAILPMTGIPITFAHLNCAGMYWRLGRWQDAERSLSTAEQIMQKKDDPEAMSFLRFHQAEIAYVEGRFEKATAFARMAISAVPATGDEIEPHAKLIEALSLIRTGRRSEGIQSARQLIQEFDQSKSIVNAASARLMVAEALSGVNERSVARGMALDALGFSEPHMIWESVLRGHLVAARVSDSPAEAEKHRAAAGAALAQLRNLWPAGSVEGYLGRADIKLLCSRLRL